jgi:plastocyanin
MRRHVSVRFLVSVGSTIVLMALLMPMAQAQVTWNVDMGAQSKDYAKQALAFLPNEIWIYAGDSITWTSEVDEVHTVSFLKQASGGAPVAGTTRPAAGAGCTGGSQGGAVAFPPSGSSFNGTSCVSSPILVEGGTYTVTFPSAGNFKFVCLIHRDMTGAVHVLPKSATLPYNQFDYDKIAAEQANALINDAGGAKAQSGHPGTGTNQVVSPGELLATGGGKQFLSIMRFLPTKIVVHAGDTVEWTDTDPATPHTVTFTPPGVQGTVLQPGAGAVVGANAALDDDGARHGTVPNTAGTATVCGANTTCFNSGIYGPAAQDQTAQTALGVTRIRVTFPTPGTYDYYCILHGADLGMAGTVVVLK